MKTLVILAVASLFMACSSSKNQPDTAQNQVTPPAPVVQDVPQKSLSTATALIKKEVCESGKDKRVLEVDKKAPGCELSYTKFGKASVVSSGKFGTKHCESSLEKITKKLESQKFKCEAS